MSGQRNAYDLNYKNLMRGAEFFRREGSIKVPIKHDGVFRITVYDEDAATFLCHESELIFDRAVALFRCKLMEVKSE